ncbi:MAG: glycosyltransferase family 9 protein [Candidatus Baltobacteraceae bacterium]
MTRALLYCAGGGIGDSLIASVVARALHERYATVDALTLPAHRCTLEHVPDIDRVMVDDDLDDAHLASRLRDQSYDACVVTWATTRTARVPELAGIPIRVGQSRRLYSFRFTKRVVVRSERGDVTSHWSDVLLDYARAIGCDTSDRFPRFIPTAGDDAETFELLAKLGVEAKNVIVMHPTNAIAPKAGIWPVSGWAALARALRKRFDVTVLISGSRADATINDAIAAQSGARSIAGTIGIGAFGALARRARAFVGITTGSMHVAAASGAVTVGIFPFQSDFPERWAPLGARTAVVRASYPCHAGDKKETCADYACIANLDVPRILAETEAALASDASTLHV